MPLSSHIFISNTVYDFEPLAVLRKLCFYLQQIRLRVSLLREALLERLLAPLIHEQLHIESRHSALLVFVNIELLQKFSLLRLVVGRVLQGLRLYVRDKLLSVSTVERLPIQSHKLVAAG
jgi:hypothetical protein